MTFGFSSLRATLLLPFVGLVITVASAIGGLSYLTGVRAVEEFSEQMLRDVSNRVTQATASHLATPKLALNAVSPDAQSLLPGATSLMNDVAPNTFAAIEQRLWLSTGLFSQVSGYIYFGAADGRFIGVNRSSAGTEVRVKDTVGKQRVAYRSSGPGIRGDELRRDDYDPRLRPWYSAAVAAKNLTWSPVYVSTTSEALTITLAKPFYDATDKLQGVVATDLPLEELDRFVNTLQVSATGVAFIVDSRGELVAASSSERLIAQEKGLPARLKASASENALIRAAYAKYESSRKSNAFGADAARMRFDSERGVVDLAVTPQTDSAGLDWTMLVAIPRADHMGNLRNTLIQNIAIGALAVAIAISFGLWVSQRVARDVTRLSEATRLLASGQSPAAFDVNRADELGSIAKSMAQMSSGILTDPLTGALNRSTFEKRFDALQTQRGGAQSVSGALVFVDLNDFKSINDIHGHAVGDAVLAVSAQRLASALRRSDLLGRFGGDEFLLLLADLGSQRDIEAALERFREQLRTPINVAGKSLSVNASFGVARFPEDGTTLNALTQKADERMYDNKHQRKLKLVVNDER